MSSSQSQAELYQIADELRATACLGLKFVQNPYDIECFERVGLSTNRLAQPWVRPSAVKER